MVGGQGVAIELSTGGLGEPPSSRACRTPSRPPLPTPGCALQGALASGRGLSLSPKSQPYFLQTGDSREVAVHRGDDPDGLGGGRLSLTTQGDSD